MKSCRFLLYHDIPIVLVLFVGLETRFKGYLVAEIGNVLNHSSI